MTDIRPTRRQIITMAAALAFSTVAGKAFAQTDDDTGEAPLILRPEIEGVDPRYAGYALNGDDIFPSAPFVISSGLSNVAVFHPRNVASARPIIFSHGALASPISYRNLIWQWVSHGFIVLAPQHDDAIIENGPTLRKNNVNTYSNWPVSALLEDARNWDKRVQACKACLDVADLVKGSTGVTMEMDRPVIAGHGYGAYIAQLLLGAKVKGAGDSPMSFRDPRFFSGVFLSPQGPGIMGLDEHSWEDMAAPCLHMISEGELDFTGQPYDVKAKAYQLSHSGYKHLGILHKGSSNTFSGQMTNSPHELKLFEVLKAMSTAFLLSYSDYDQTAFADMTTHFFERMSLGAVTEYIR